MQKMIILTPDDEILAKEYSNDFSISDAVEGEYSELDIFEIPVLPFLCNGQSKMKVELFCNDGFIIKKRFDKINALASLISGQIVYGNVAVLKYKNEEEYPVGFECKEEASNKKIAETISECWCVEDIFFEYMDKHFDEIEKLHSMFDKFKPSIKLIYEFANA